MVFHGRFVEITHWMLHKKLYYGPGYNMSRTHVKKCAKNFIKTDYYAKNQKKSIKDEWEDLYRKKYVVLSLMQSLSDRLCVKIQSCELIQQQIG